MVNPATCVTVWARRMASILNAKPTLRRGAIPTYVVARLGVVEGRLLGRSFFDECGMVQVSGAPIGVPASHTPCSLRIHNQGIRPLPSSCVGRARPCR